MSSVEGSPPAPSGASPTKKVEKPEVVFTAKEEHLLKVAMMHCLKSGPPEIDYNAFVKYGEFKTLKTAQNTWGKIKSKLVQAAGPKTSGEGEEDGEGGGGGDEAGKSSLCLCLTLYIRELMYLLRAV